MADEGIAKDACRNRSWVTISRIRTLSVKRLGKKLGRISAEELEQVINALSEIVGA
jgi:mRNA interferase MazF